MKIVPEHDFNLDLPRVISEGAAGGKFKLIWGKSKLFVAKSMIGKR